MVQRGIEDCGRGRSVERFTGAGCRSEELGILDGRGASRRDEDVVHRQAEETGIEGEC